MTAGDLDRALFFVADVDAADEGREGLSEWSRLNRVILNC